MLEETKIHVATCKDCEAYKDGRCRQYDAVMDPNSQYKCVINQQHARRLSFLDCGNRSNTFGPVFIVEDSNISASDVIRFVADHMEDRIELLDLH